MGSSPPPTPPSRPPGRGESRFKPLSGACERVERYHPGGYHRVDVGDVLHDGQYKVVRKLGYGSFSTVWLVRDVMHNTYAALKIVVARASEGKTELQEVTLYRRLAQTAGGLDRHITKLRGTFQLQGPNGVHTCIVFEPMGPNVNTMVEALPEFNPRTRGMRILRGALEALQLLHAHSIAHGDVPPGNMLFPLRAGRSGIADDSSCLDDESERSLWQPDNANPELSTSISNPIERRDGKVDRWAPRHLYTPQPLVTFADRDPGFCVKLSDLGGAYLITDPPSEIVTPAGLRAPELIFQASLRQDAAAEDGRPLDVWSVGCLVFELVAGTPLFCVPGSRNRDAADDGRLLALAHVLGPLPDDQLARWTRSSRYFQYTEDGNRTLTDAAAAYGFKFSPMEDMFDEAAPEVASPAEARQIKALIRRILQYDAAQRPTAAEILQDAWFAEDDERGAEE